MVSLRRNCGTRTVKGLTMLISAAIAPITLDITTFFVIATCITALLGLLLLSAWMQERVRALAWWGAAYLLGGFPVAVWGIEGISPPWPPGTANALPVRRLRHDLERRAHLPRPRRALGHDVRRRDRVAPACLFPEFAQSAAARIVLSSHHRFRYTFLTAAELWRERRKTLLRRWPAIFVPILHGAVFLFPIPLASLLPADGGVMSLAGGWLAIFALETMLYVVGTAFIVLVLAKGAHRARPPARRGLHRRADRAAQPARLFRRGRQLIRKHERARRPAC